MNKICAFLLGTLPLSAIPGHAQAFADDFNRPNSTDMGPDWSEVSGDMVIAGNQGAGNLLPTGWSKMIHTAAGANYDQAVARITMVSSVGSSGPHVALVFGDGGLRNIYTKIQDNNSDGLFDRLFWYSNDNGTSWGNSSSITLSPPFASARVEMYVTNAGDTMNVDIDDNLDGVVDQHYENTGLLAFADQLGQGFGIGTWAGAIYDDWEIELPPQGLSGTPETISLINGGTQSFSLDAGPPFAGLPYVLLGTLSGTDPGLPLDGVVLPLNADAYTVITLIAPNTPPLAGSFGTLDASGKGVATFTLSPGSPMVLAGLRLHHAFVVIELLPTLLHVVYASDPVPLLLIP